MKAVSVGKHLAARDTLAQSGTVMTGFGRKAFAEPTQIVVDSRNRIIVGGIVFSSPRLATGNGVGMVRFLGGR